MGGFEPNMNLINNPDFQSLMDMLNLAKQLQTPLNLFQPISDLNMNAEVF